MCVWGGWNWGTFQNEIGSELAALCQHPCISGTGFWGPSQLVEETMLEPLLRAKTWAWSYILGTLGQGPGWSLGEGLEWVGPWVEYVVGVYGGAWNKTLGGRGLLGAGFQCNV